MNPWSSLFGRDGFQHPDPVVGQIAQFLAAHSSSSDELEIRLGTLTFRPVDRDGEPRTDGPVRYHIPGAASDFIVRSSPSHTFTFNPGVSKDQQKKVEEVLQALSARAAAAAGAGTDYDEPEIVQTTHLYYLDASVPRVLVVAPDPTWGRDYYPSTATKQRIRVEKDAQGNILRYTRKQKKGQLDIYCAGSNLSMRLMASNEENIPEPSVLGPLQLIRERSRRSWLFDLFRVDFTVVEEKNPINHTRQKVVYEVEVELLNPSAVAIEANKYHQQQPNNQLMAIARAFYNHGKVLAGEVVKPLLKEVEAEEQKRKLQERKEQEMKKRTKMEPKPQMYVVRPGYYPTLPQPPRSPPPRTQW